MNKDLKKFESFIDSIIDDAIELEDEICENDHISIILANFVIDECLKFIGLSKEEQNKLSIKYAQYVAKKIIQKGGL